MIISRLSIFIALISFVSIARAQDAARLYGVVKDQKGKVIELANVIHNESQKVAITDSRGRFSLILQAGDKQLVTVKFVGFKPRAYTVDLAPGEEKELNITLIEETRILQDVEIKGERSQAEIEEVSVTAIDPKLPRIMPSVSQDFNKILATLPGVSSQNELSSEYTVRGGNFDENLIYVNDIPVYRPFLIRAGQQEGLSFVNPDLTASAEFSAGGWQPRYGDKLSSVLNVTYKEPKKFGGSISGGLLGGTMHLEGSSKNKRFSHITGVRHKRLEFLLNTLETSGEYLPRFTDVQSYMSYDLTPEESSIKERTKFGLLNAYSRNRYNVIPAARESTFGTVQEVIRLFVAFDGQEEMEYDTYQGGLSLSHKWSEKFKSSITQSLTITRERENQDLEAGYRLCDVGTNLGDTTFDQCISERGIGTIYNYGRNNLTATILNTVNRNELQLNEKNEIEFGLQYGVENIEDRLNEYSFVDSSDYVNVTETRQSSIQINSQRIEAYVQHSVQPDSVFKFTYGVRLNYWNVNDQLLISPRAQLYVNPRWKKDVRFKAAAGVYQQPPFYRELRNYDGTVNRDVKAQRSYHFILGGDYRFQIWSRDFKLTTEAYVKYLDRVIPYDVDNVRIRYYPEVDATAYNIGMDVRIGGEFIPGAESWFSLGILSSREDVANDDKGYIRRPSDQRLNLGIFFQDHLPNNPSLRAYINLVYGTGLPFGPPRRPEFRAELSAPSYKRVDVGFTKVLLINPDDIARRGLKSLRLGVEVLNIIAANNVISYIWIQDVTGNTYAIPNTLSQRFLNFRVIAEF
jgi:hypothetical protein